MRIVYMRSNPINPYPRAEKQMNAAMEHGHTPVALAWDRRASKSGMRLEKLSLPAGEMDIYRFGIKADFNQGLKNLIPLLLFQLALLKWLFVHRKEYDLIHAYDFDTVLPALLMKMLFGKKYVYDICDFYIDAFYVPRQLKPIIKKMDFFAIRQAEALILVNEARIEQVKGSRPKRVEYIHNTPFDMVDEIPRREHPKPTLLYVGILQNRRMIKEALEIFARHPEWQLIIGGYGSLEALCKEAADKHDNIAYLGKIPYKQVLELTCHSDALFACYSPQVANHKYSSPNKLYEAMMCEKPIIVCKNTGIDRIVESEEIGLTIDYDQEQFELAIKYLFDNEAVRLEMGARARQLYEQQYSWNIMKQRLGNLYSEISYRDRGISQENQKLGGSY
ncbi:glycosyltransferase family 4 protein [Paenibacillus ginsengihumi]|uniref:glycosyltransferase family 4 protein n=1 Tax=Paenibacillus ginsengihumi TaxID=431596 RepID=UPI00036404CE|nr:glycosyltransferase family 4 protein [Paenibacillus ginsengihumi]